MKLTWLCWYLSGYFALALLGASFVTIHPDAEQKFAVVQALFGISTFAFMALAIRLGRLPETHWVHLSGSRWADVLLAITILILAFGCLL